MHERECALVLGVVFDCTATIGAADERRLVRGVFDDTADQRSRT
ncbi:MAG: hypothetical protein ABEI27_00730 [Halobellus sp.]